MSNPFDNASSAVKTLEGDIQALKAQDNASPGLQAVVAATKEYLLRCAENLGSGHPEQAPDFSSLITGNGHGFPDLSNPKELTDETNHGQLAANYNKHVGDVRAVTNNLAQDDKTVDTHVEDIPTVTDKYCQQIDEKVNNLQGSLDNPTLPNPPNHDYGIEGAMISACLDTAEGVYADLTLANSDIKKRAQAIAAHNPPPLRYGSTETESFQSNGVPYTATYGAPLPASQIQSMVSGVTDESKKNFLQNALSKVGDPYVFGAEGPNAFDCSGLVQWAAGKAGIHLPRTADEQWAATMNHQVSPNNLQPGDLIFPDAEFNGGNPDHIMIYIGNGECVEAPHTGEDVKTISLSQVGGFHATRF